MPKLILLLLISGWTGIAPGIFAAAEAPPAVLEAALPETAGSGTTLTVVGLKSAPPEAMRDLLKNVGRRWGLFAGLEIMPVAVEGSAGGALIFRGREEEAASASQLARALDGFLAPAEAEAVLDPIPLEHLSAARMKELLLGLAASAPFGLSPGQLLIYPEGPAGGLFVLGPDAARIKTLAGAFDQPRYGSTASLLGAFWREFRADLGRHFLTLSTYLVSALILLGLHFLLTVLPGIGTLYGRSFTLVWTRLLDGIKGRDFAYEILKSLAATAAAAARTSGNAATAPAAGIPDPAERAWAVGRKLLRYRGFDPDDPALGAVFRTLLEAELNTPGGR